MKKLLFILLSFLPSFLHVAIRRMMGQKIGKKSRIKIGTLIFSRKVEIGSGTRIGPFTFMLCRELKIGDHVTIRPLVIINTQVVEMGDYVHFASLAVVNSGFTMNSRLTIGDHSRVFPFCWLDTAEGLEIGRHVGIGGHTLMFTHGVWSNYVDGGPVSFGPIKLKDNVWLPWRVFILPNVTIGENVIVGANSLVNKSVEANALVAGNPAKVIKKFDFNTDLPEKIKRFKEIVEKFSAFMQFKHDIKSELRDGRLVFNNQSIVINEFDRINENDLIIVMNENFDRLNEFIERKVSVLYYPSLTVYVAGKKNLIIEEFVPYLRRFGIRLYIK